MVILGIAIMIAVTLELFWPESDTKGNVMTIESALAVECLYGNIGGKTPEQAALLHAAWEVIRKYAEQAERLFHEPAAVVHPQPGDA